MKNHGELHDLYIITDVMILADFVDSFRETVLEKYKVDPAHFMIAPSLSWAACLRKTRVKLELLTDPDMTMFIDKSLIGGIIAILSPLALADNPQMGKLYDPSKPLNTILYVDANNLYGWAMPQYLPTGRFEWIQVSENDEWVDFILKQWDEQEEG